MSKLFKAMTAIGGHQGQRIDARAERTGLRRLLLAAASVAVIGAPAVASAADDQAAPAQKSAPHEVSEVVVNGIPYRETVLPTRLPSNSIYGFDLNVMDTPRNATLLSTTQLETLNIQDPRAFSYLTASSYTDSAFGTPNIPRIRGQYADVFYNGMRWSFTDNGYGAPPNFDSLENISITKGPASVIDGNGPGVGGKADFLTKRPNMFHMVEQGSFSVDTVNNRRWSLDVGGPIERGVLGFRVSYSGDDDGSYFYSHYLRKNAVYAALRWQPTDRYRLDFNTEVISEQYTENVGVNRVNQALIDHTQIATGAPVGELYSTLIDSDPLQVGSPGNPYAPVAPILTAVNLTGEAPLNTRVTIDQTPGTSARALLYNAQIIQNFDLTDTLKLQNNTFFGYIDSDNQDYYYYADASRGSWFIENRIDLADKYEFTFAGHTIKNEWIAGGSYRFAHTNYISDYSAETPGVYDLTANPKLWVFDGPTQLNYADAFIYKTSFGRYQYGVPGRDATGAGNTGISNLSDGAVFIQDRLELTPKFSVMLGGRADVVQNKSFDPLGGAVCDFCFTSVYYNGSLPLPQSYSSGTYVDWNGNVSLVYKIQPWVTTYATFNFSQSVNPDGGVGGVNLWGQVKDTALLRVPSYLYEGGFKFNLLNNKLFIGLAGFQQQREVATGPGGTATSQANIRGMEIEANYQPNRNFYATASYSYIATTLDKPAGFYNYPAYLGNQYPLVAPDVSNTLFGTPNTGTYNYIDGAGLFATFAKGQRFNDPGIPQHVFNVLGNYKFPSGIGFRLGAQVIGPIQTTTSGRLDLAASSLVPASVIANGGYYQSPVIPWQYTMNAAVFYEIKNYTFTFSVYNLTDRINWQSAPSFYGNDFLVRNDPRTFEFRIQAKF